MNERREASGKISDHDKGLGTVTRQMIEDRAAEIAVIEGRSRPTKEDRLLARRELLGAEGALHNVEELEDLDSLDPSEVKTEPGHHAPNFATDDEEAVGREMVEHGIQEAQHEQMLEGHYRDEDETEGVEERPKKRKK